MGPHRNVIVLDLQLHRRRGGSDWKKAFAPVPMSEASSKSRSFHFNVTFTTKDATCVQKAEAGTVGVAPKCDGGPECTVQYYTGEFFLATSPSWIKATSFGLLSADSRYVDVTLTQGWDDCMPTEQRAERVHEVDALLHWMLDSSGQSGGYLARRAWNRTSATDAADVADPGDEVHEVWDVLDLGTCEDGATVGDDAPCRVQAYQPSAHATLFFALYVSTTVAIVAYMRTVYQKWERLQSQKFQQTLQVFFPHHGDPAKQRLAMIAAWCRKVALKEPHRCTNKSMHEWFAKFFVEELDIKAEYTGSEGKFNFGTTSREVDLGKLPQYREYNPWLSRKTFVTHFKPFVARMQEARKYSTSAAGLRVRNFGSLCDKLLCRDSNKRVCEDLFEEISGEDEFVSLDELQDFICFFHEDYDSDEDGDDDEEDRHKMNEEHVIKYVDQHTEFHKYVEGIEGGDDHCPITGINALSDMIMGGPDKVVSSLAKILASAALQGAVAVAPLLLPCVMAWLRGNEPAEVSGIYATDNVPPIGSTSDYQNAVFLLAALLLGLAMVENLLYTVTHRELLRPKDHKQQCVMSCLFALSAFVNQSFKAIYVVAMFITLAQLVQALILIIMALTVDPCRTIAALLSAMALFFYIKNSVSSFRKVRNALREQITANAIKGKESKDSKDDVRSAAKKAGISKKSLQKLEEIVDDELDRAGFSASSLIQWVIVTLVCALLLVSVVLTAQKLFFQEQQQGLAQLVASTFSSVGLMATQLKKKQKEEKQIQKTILGVQYVLLELQLSRWHFFCICVLVLALD